jgi:hypothetical protein
VRGAALDARNLGCQQLALESHALETDLEDPRDQLAPLLDPFAFSGFHRAANLALLRQQ